MAAEARLFDKLNLKQQAEILLINAPPGFEAANAELEGRRILRSHDEASRVSFALVFAIRQADVDNSARVLCPKLDGDAVIWFAYPKASSRKYKCEFNRDNGWAVLGQLGLEPVRQVAIDEDWSALRFRRVEFIKTMTRSFAMTEEGKSKSRKARAESRA